MLQRFLFVFGFLLLALVAGWTWLDSQEKTPEPEPAPVIEASGRWHKLPPEDLEPSRLQEQREMVAQLEAIGYASGSVEAPSRSGVTLHEADRVSSGLNFFTSGHAPEAVLMDMQGRVVHRWRYELLDVWPDYPQEWLPGHSGFWRRAALLPNGDVVAIFEGMGIIQVDRDSKLVWANPIAAHHDLEVMANGEVWVLTRRVHIVPRIDPAEPVIEDFISLLGRDGKEKKRISILEAFERSEYNHLWSTPAEGGAPDLFHANTIEVLDGRAAKRVAAFARGNILISALTPSVIAVIDPKQQKVVWATKGDFERQHDPKITQSGKLLLFDNLGAGEHSRVLEFDPARPDQWSWSYTGTAEAPFFTETCGTAERLANGNTLIVESDGGRVFEVTEEKEVVWEFYNPNRAGPDGDYIATLFDVVRLPPDFPTHWIRDDPR